MKPLPFSAKALRILLLTTAGALVLAGCATTAPSGVPYTQASSALSTLWHKHQAAVGSIIAFTLNARVATQGSFGITGDLRWHEQNGQFQIHFSGPFGAGAVEIAGDPYVVQIRSGDKRYVTSHPRAFLLKQFGWTLPLKGLRYWALGLPAPDRAGTPPAKLTLDDRGRLRSLTQDGWTINYLSYQTTGQDESYPLPHKLVMHGQTTEFRIVIDRWQGLATKRTAQVGIIALADGA